MYSKIVEFLFLIYVLLIKSVHSSQGDQSPYYRKCLERCEFLNCTEDGKEFIEDNQPYILKITLWNCNHECKYQCMWKTVEAFHEHNWRTPQFHGKWPFIRILGMQEPASVIFSLLNAFAHIKMMRRFREEVRPNSPLVWLWNVFFVVCVHGWFWSAVFHYRDFLFTEILDYACAFSMVLISCYIMSFRFLYEKAPKLVLLAVSLFFIFFLISHVGYLSMGKIDYGYNMELNIAVATVTALGWFAWCIYNRKRQRYVWKCAIFIAVSGLLLLLELIDRPPYLFMFDYHSLWHLSTAPLPLLIYSFAIDDCKYLKNKKSDSEYKNKRP